MQRSGGATLARVSRPRCPGGLAKDRGYNPGLPTRFSEEPLQVPPILRQFNDDKLAPALIGTKDPRAWLSLHEPMRLILARLGGSAPRLGLTPALTGTALAA